MASIANLLRGDDRDYVLSRAPSERLDAQPAAAFILEGIVIKNA